MRLLALFRLRVRLGIDELVTWGVTALAIALAIGYQVLGRRLRDDEPERPTDP